MPNYERALTSVSVRWRTKIKKIQSSWPLRIETDMNSPTLNGGRQALLSKQGGANLPLT
jgi:hypothetical protein